MDKLNKKALWKVITKKGDLLKGNLPSLPDHPNGRNPYAHVCSEIRKKFGRSYKDIPDESYGDVIKYIQRIK